MATMILAFMFFLLLIGAMAIGVILGRAPISGSCGGMKALGMDVECEICGGNPALCDVSEPAATKIDSDLTSRIGR